MSMRLYSTNNKSRFVSLKEAVFKGLLRAAGVDFKDNHKVTLKLADGVEINGDTYVLYAMLHVLFNPDTKDHVETFEIHKVTF